MFRIGTRHASANRGEECSRLLTPQPYESRLREAVFDIGREYNKTFRPSQRYLSDGGEALSQVMNASTSATTANLLPPPFPTAERPPHWYAVYTSPRHEKRV